MKRFLFIIVYIMLSPIIVQAQNGNIKVSYNIQAEVNFVDQTIIIKEKVNSGEKLIEPSHEEKEGYLFLGWFNNDERWDFENDVVTTHLTLNAKYKEVNNIIVDTTNQTDNFLESSMSIDYDDINITDEEKEYLADDHVINIWLEINDITDSISNEEKETINNLTNEEKLDVDYYLDIDLFKQIDGIESTKEQVYKTKNSIKVTITIPENIRDRNRKYHVIRLHDGKAEEIYSGVPNENWELIFETNKFSSYAIAHSNIRNSDNPGTLDNINTYIKILLLSSIVLIPSAYYIKKRNIKKFIDLKGGDM